MCRRRNARTGQIAPWPLLPHDSDCHFAARDRASTAFSAPAKRQEYSWRYPRHGLAWCLRRATAPIQREPASADGRCENKHTLSSRSSHAKRGAGAPVSCIYRGADIRIPSIAGRSRQSTSSLQYLYIQRVHICMGCRRITSRCTLKPSRLLGTKHDQFGCAGRSLAFASSRLDEYGYSVRSHPNVRQGRVVRSCTVSTYTIYLAVSRK
jgi:hypothetical protein